MEEKKKIIENIDKINTTKMGIDRIKKNLNLEVEDVTNWCINKIRDMK